MCGGCLGPQDLCLGAPVREAMGIWIKARFEKGFLYQTYFRSPSLWSLFQGADPRVTGTITG